MTKQEVLRELKGLAQRPVSPSSALVDQWLNNEDFRKASSVLANAATLRHQPDAAPSVPTMPPC